MGGRNVSVKGNEEGRRDRRKRVKERGRNEGNDKTN